jgi:hypothetical protein
MKTLIIFLSAVVLGGIAYLLLRKKDYNQPESELKQEKLDKLTLHYVREYFLKQEINISENKPIMLAIKKSSENNFGIDFEEGFEYFVLTYYNENKGEILSDNTLVIATKQLDSNLTDALGDKEMLLLN